METVVPQEITAELTQILANLVLGDNTIRSKYGSIRNDHARTDETPLVQRRRSTIALLRLLTSIYLHWLSSPLQPIQKWQVANP